MCRRILTATVIIIAALFAQPASGQLREQSPTDAPVLQPIATHSDGTSTSEPAREKMARVWVNEPPLLRLARDKFGPELTETDAKFFAAVANSESLDLRPTPKS